MNVWNTVELVRARSPLVHCYTNSVASNFAANALISAGASPMMAAEPLEAREVTSVADALTVNIGTLTPITAEAMSRSAEVAVIKKIPWVLDPVGVGASQLRKETSAKLARMKPSIIRGNASEIATLCKIISPDAPSAGKDARGVDTALSSDDVVAQAKILAKAVKTVVVVSGKVDWITDGERVSRIVNGDSKMAQVTATGCACTAMLGAFIAVLPEDPFWAAAHGMSFYAVAGELASAEAVGTGSMVQQMLDKFGTMTKEQYTAQARPPIDLSLYLVTDPVLLKGRALEEVVASSLSSGAVSIVQLREKDCDSGEFLERARRIKSICDERNVPLLIDDRVDIALAIDCAGVHIGQSDLPPSVARRLLGPSKIIGLSAHTIAQVETAATEDIDYYGIGPVYGTQTKKVGRPALAPEGYAEVAAASKLPTVAIGGLKIDNVSSLPSIAAGAAIVTGITEADSPAEASKQLLANFRQRDR